MIVTNVNFYYIDYLLPSFQYDDVRSVNYQISLPIPHSHFAKMQTVNNHQNKKKPQITNFKCEQASDKMHHTVASSSANDVVASLVHTIYSSNTLTQKHNRQSGLWCTWIDRPTFRHVQIGFCGIVKRFPNERVSLELYECGGDCDCDCVCVPHLGLYVRSCEACTH